MVNSEIQFSQPTVSLTHAETDHLLQTVSDQLSQGILDQNDEYTLKRLVECLGDTRGMTRLRVAETLGSIGKPATPFLQIALEHHTNPVVRRAAAKTLTLIADPNTIPALLNALLRDPDTVVKGSSVAALAKMGTAVVPDLLKILESSDSPNATKGHAAWALAFIGADAQDYLYQALDSDSSEVRAAIVGAIAKVAEEMSETDGLQILIDALQDPAGIVRYEAAVALGNLSYQPALPKLLDLLHHEDWETRKSAALALMKIGDARSVESLHQRLLTEPEPAVQKVIELSIARIEKG